MTDTDTIVINVNPNQMPFANAGPDQTVSDADGDNVETVTLDGSASYDPDGTIQSYEWDTNGDGQTDAYGVTVDAAFSLGSHTVTLTVTDNGGETDTDYVSITVNEPSVGVTVESITPNSMSAGSTIPVVITGSGFANGANVILENGVGPAPSVFDVVIDGNTINATVKAKSGGPPRDRVWDVRVTNPDGSSGVLVGGFIVTP